MRSCQVGGGLSAALVAITSAAVPVTLLVHAPVASAASFVVDSAGDETDLRLDGTCRTAAGTCTLRAAMSEANFVAGADVIGFALPGSGVREIRPATRLPILTDPAGVLIDGYTQPGSSPNTDPLVSNAVILVQLRGTGASGIDGIQTTSPGNTIRGLALFNFRRAIYLYGPSSAGNVVVGNFVGTDATGTFQAPSYVTGASGVLVQAGARDNVIGRPAPADRNVLSGNAHHGFASYDDNTDRNVVRNNIVGLTPAGTAARPNRGHGIDVNTWSSANLIGGTGPLEANLVSGNLGEGIEISHGSGTLDNRVIGNLIGTAPGGTSAPAYARNALDGVNLEGWAVCEASCPADSGRHVVTDNVIVNSGSGGIKIAKGVHDSVIARNLIGVLPNGVAAPNAVWGVRIEKGSFRNVIGPGNQIAHNPNPIQLVPDGSSPASPTPIATYANTFTRNSIRAATGLGIDLAPLGSVTAAPDPLVNDGAAIPTITAARADRVTVATCAGCTVEVFESERPAGAFGPGSEYLASAVANSSGVAEVAVAPVGRVRSVTATSTRPTGATSEFARNVDVPSGTNTPPFAYASSVCVGRTCTFDGSGSTDADGPLAAFAWDFGDGGTGAGATAQHTYLVDGTYTATLAVTDLAGATNSTTVEVVVVGVPQPPQALFGVACNGRSCTFDGTPSNDTDGTVVDWAWDFGDGAIGSGATVERTFAATGTYAVTLVVTDDTGLTATTSLSTSIVDRTVVADDGFDRTVTGGWGTAPTGGAWTVTSGPASSFSVDGTQGTITVPAAASGRGARLLSVSVRDAEIRAAFASPTPTTGFGSQVGIVARRVSQNNEYRVRVRLAANGTIALGVTQLRGTAAEVLLGAEVTLTGVTFVPGQRYHVVVSVTGANPTTVTAKLWADGQPEPSGWAISRTDSRAVLQQPGSPGVHFASSSSTTTLPVGVLLDSYTVTALL